MAAKKTAGRAVDWPEIIDPLDAEHKGVKTLKIQESAEQRSRKVESSS